MKDNKVLTALIIRLNFHLIKILIRHAKSMEKNLIFYATSTLEGFL